MIQLVACASPRGSEPAPTESEAETGTVIAGSEARVVTAGLESPFELAWGPEGNLWVTERVGKRVTSIDLTTGQGRTLLTLDDAIATAGQDGLLGMAFDDDDRVYLAYTYAVEAETRRTRLVRYTWNGATLDSPLTLIEGMPGSNDHNTGRLVYGPDAHLYYAIGDQGANQDGNFCNPILSQSLPTPDMVAAQDWSTYQGKVLRLKTDGSIPDDNPILAGVRSHVWTYGHRNAQGLVFSPDGTLWSAEHGPMSDDEINVLEAGGNYGWPGVVGYQDDRAYTYANWSASIDPPCSELAFDDFTIPASVPVAEEHEFAGEVREPELTMYTVEDDWDFADPLCAEADMYFVCWPTLAPSSLAWHDGGLLLTSLKLGTLYSLQPGGEPEELYHTVDRYRRVVVSPDGSTAYVATDATGWARDDDGTPTKELTNIGAILELPL